MMRNHACAEFELLLQADVDGELSAAEAAAVTAHRSQCLHCTALYKELIALRERLRLELQSEQASTGFRTALAAKIAAAEAAASPSTLTSDTPASKNPKINASAPAARSPSWYRQLWPMLAGAFGTGGLAAACLMLLLLKPATPDVSDEILTAHIRALQPGHLMDVVSTDQHNVKPWFEGKVDFAPPVKNLSDKGFPLVGGRLDYLDGRTVAVMIYQRAKHPINLYAWPTTASDTSTSSSTREGFNLEHWTQDGMELWVSSDLNQKELGEFVGMWRGM